MATPPGLFIGTSGWAYPEWKPAFYPPEVRREDFLAHHASVLGACEVNATFRRLQSPATMARWAAAVPPGYRFAIKAHMRLTHAAGLGGDPAFLAAFLASLDALGDRLGAVLLQFPPARARDDADLAILMQAVSARAPFAVEFRHDSWDAPAVRAAVAAAGGTVCLNDPGGPPPAALPPGPLAYVRLRGTAYHDGCRDAWLERLGAEAVHRPVYVFARHKDVPAGDPHAGVGLAAWMAARHSLRG